MEPARVALHCFLWLGIGMVLTFVILGLNRSYLLLLGLAFLGCALALLVPMQFRWLVIAPVLFLLFLAVMDAVHDTQTRIARQRLEQQEREAAFAELQLALIEANRAKQDMADLGGKR